MPTAFLVQPLRDEFEPVRAAVQRAAVANDLTLVRPDSFFGGEPLLTSLFRELEAADIVIADLTGSNRNVIYELGFAQGVQRPVIPITREPSPLPSDVSGLSVLVYGPDPDDLERFENMLQESMAAALRDPSDFVRRAATRRDARRVFISYSHQDADVLKRLLVHLRPLSREGLIDAWSDTLIEAGADWQHEVSTALRNAAAAILLVSADFLASDFIVDNELPPLFDKAAKEGTLIIPVIVKPCRYTRDPELRRLQAINDPARPLAALPAVEQEGLLDAVAAAVERAMRQAG
jgi:hypothetical protein